MTGSDNSLDSYAYQVWVGDEAQAGFADCHGLDGSVQIKKGLLVTLHMGAIASNAFYDWIMQHATAQNLRVVQRAEDGALLRAWDLAEARVVKVTATTFTKIGFPFRVEALELAAETITACTNL
jgi:hypothetical protein